MGALHATAGRARGGRGALSLALALAAAASTAQAALPPHPAITEGPTPPWVAPAGPLQPAPAGASAVAYRLVDDQLHLDGDATAAYFARVVEVLSQQGLGEAAEWEADFDPSSQRLRVHALEVFRDGVWSDRLASSRASVLQREPELSRQVYDETLTLLLVVEDVRVGDLVRIAYTVEGFNPVFGGRYAGSFTLGWGVPVGERRVRLSVPVDQPLLYRVHGAEATPAERTEEDGRLWLTWRQLDVPAVKPESDVPPGWVSYPFLQVSQFASWAEVAAWGRQLYPARPVPAPLAEVAARIAAAHPGDDAARLVAAARWVQDEVRYFAIALGPHSHQPHEPGEILRRRYGDCKDKARLLVGLLGALGITAWPAMVNSELDEAVTDRLPSPFAFDHVVLVARLGEEEVWIDPTLELQGGAAGDLWLPAYGAALELRPGVAELTAIPAAQSSRGRTAVHYDYRLTHAGEPFEVDIETTFERAGAERMRRQLAAETAEELAEDYVRFYIDGERTVAPRAPLAIVDDREANRVVVTERYRVEGCWERSGTLLSCDLLPLLMSSTLVEPETVERSAPLGVRRDVHTRETVSIHTATPWQLEPVTEDEHNPWFEFTVSSTSIERGIEMVYELRTTAPRVEPENVARYAHARRAVVDALGYSLQLEEPLERRPGGGGDDPREALYLATGCAVLLAVPLLAAVVGIGLAVILYRRRRRAGPPWGSAATCPRCAVLTLPGARFCAACGAPLSLAAARRPRVGGAAFAGALAAGCGLLVVAGAGTVAAITIPNLKDALGRARQKRTLADMRRLATGLETYRTAAGAYPEAATTAELAAALAAAGALDGAPTDDAWKRPLRYVCWQRQATDGCDDYRLASPGADGELEQAELGDYPGETTTAGDFDRDLVLGPDGVVQAPAGLGPSTSTSDGGEGGPGGG